MYKYLHSYPNKFPFSLSSKVSCYHGIISSYLHIRHVLLNRIVGRKILYLNIRAFWDVAQCSLFVVNGRFRGAYCLHHQVDGGGSTHLFCEGPRVAQLVKCLATYWTTGRSKFDLRQWQEIFPISSASRPALGPTQPPVQWVPVVLCPGVKRGWCVTLTTHTA
jgi:hypothetical protein